MDDARITLPDGRTLAYTDIGDPDGSCVVTFHGAPASRSMLAYLDEAFAERGLRVVSPDRPGYGGSSPQPERSMADWPADVEALADALDIERFAVLGSSSGGAYAVACCACLPRRVVGGVVVAGATDMSWPRARDGFPEVEVTIMDLADEAAAVEWCTEQFGADGSGFLEHDPLEWPEPDEAFLAEESMSQHLVTVTEEAFAQGVAGYAQDLVVQGRPWPFDPAEIRCPVHVRHGEFDDLVPMDHSRHTAELIPGATFDTVAGHGHASILDEFPRLTADLVGSAT